MRKCQAFDWNIVTFAQKTELHCVYNIDTDLLIVRSPSRNTQHD
jgi:hypothetical protein